MWKRINNVYDCWLGDVIASLQRLFNYFSRYTIESRDMKLILNIYLFKNEI